MALGPLGGRGVAGTLEVLFAKAPGKMPPRPPNRLSFHRQKLNDRPIMINLNDDRMKRVCFGWYVMVQPTIGS